MGYLLNESSQRGENAYRKNVAYVSGNREERNKNGIKGKILINSKENPSQEYL